MLSRHGPHMTLNVTMCVCGGEKPFSGRVNHSRTAYLITNLKIHGSKKLTFLSKVSWESLMCLLGWFK